MSSNGGFRMAGVVVYAVVVMAASACERRVFERPPLEYPTTWMPMRAARYKQLAEDSLELRFGQEPQRPPGEWKTVVSFVHVSDVQLRDFGIHYFSPATERAVDSIAGSTVRRAELDLNDEYPYLALIGALNQAPTKPQFLVHTGDAIDSNSVGELEAFVYISKLLTIPWINVVGNHDRYLMGNFTKAHLRADGFDRTFPGFVSDERTRYMMSFEDAAAAPPFPPTRYHGFDCFGRLNCASWPGEPPHETLLSSYYSMSLSTSPKIRLIVLDTNRPPEAIPTLGGRQLPLVGATGHIDADQMAWLVRQLQHAREHGEYVLVFGHHPTRKGGAGLDDEDLLGTSPDGGQSTIPLFDLLSTYDNVLAYFGGHTHVARARSPSLVRWQLARLFPLPEIIAPSLHEWPQAALWIDVLKRERTLAIQVRPLEAKPGAGASQTLKKVVRDACQGANLDKNRPADGDCWQDQAGATSGFFMVAEMLDRKKLGTTKCGTRGAQCCPAPAPRSCDSPLACIDGTCASQVIVPASGRSDTGATRGAPLDFDVIARCPQSHPKLRECRDWQAGGNIGAEDAFARTSGDRATKDVSGNACVCHVHQDGRSFLGARHWAECAVKALCTDR